VASAGIAAIAALLSGLSVWQGRRERIESKRPALLLQPRYDTASGKTSCTVYNAGGGIARNVNYIIESGGNYARGVLARGFIAPGEEVEVSTQLPSAASPDVHALVDCFEPNGRRYGWDEAGRGKRLLRFPRRVDDRALANVWRARRSKHKLTTEFQGTDEQWRGGVA
jgi:hypothetical protein